MHYLHRALSGEVSTESFLLSSELELCSHTYVPIFSSNDQSLGEKGERREKRQKTYYQFLKEHQGMEE